MTKPTSKIGWEWLILAAVLVIGLLARGYYFTELIEEPDFSFPRGDMAFHDYWAKGLATGDWTPPPTAEDPAVQSVPYLRPPGYPFFLAAIYTFFGHDYYAPRVFQMALGLVGAVLAFLLGRSLFGTPTGLILAALMSTYWGFMYFEGELNAPVLLIVLYLLLFNLMWKWTAGINYSLATLTGMVLGLSVLTSPNMIVVTPMIFLWGFWVSYRKKNHWKYVTKGLLFAAVSMLVIFTATLRNYLTADDPVLVSCNGGITFYSGNNKSSDGIVANPDEYCQKAGVMSWGWFNYHMLKVAVEKEIGKTLSYSELSGFFSRKAVKYIQENPYRSLKLFLKKAVLFWGPAEISSNKVIELDRRNSLVLGYSPGFSPFLALGLLGLVFAFADTAKRTFELCLMILLFVLVYYLTFIPFLVSARFRIPIIPFVLLFSAYGIYELFVLVRLKEWKKIALWLSAAVVIYFAVSVHYYPYEPSAAQWHTYRGHGFTRGGQLERAVDEFEQAYALEPENYTVLTSLASTMMNLDRLDECMEFAQRAVEARPDLGTAHFILGKAHLTKGDEEKGEHHLTMALYHEPMNYEVLWMLGNLKAEKGLFDDAITYFNIMCQINPNDPMPFLLLGSTFASKGMKEEAIRALERVLHLNPENQNARNLIKQLSK